MSEPRRFTLEDHAVNAAVSRCYLFALTPIVGWLVLDWRGSLLSAGTAVVVFAHEWFYRDQERKLRAGAPEQDAAKTPPILQNRIICAAVRFSDGRIARAHRHHNCFAVATDWGLPPAMRGHQQGFIDARGEFVDRHEARRIQDAAGIPSADPGGYRGDELFSEDLY